MSEQVSKLFGKWVLKPGQHITYCSLAHYYLATPHCSPHTSVQRVDEKGVETVADRSEMVVRW